MKARFEALRGGERMDSEDSASSENGDGNRAREDRAEKREE